MTYDDRVGLDPHDPTLPEAGDELSDDDLEQVVGGLTRPWVDPRTAWDGVVAPS